MELVKIIMLSFVLGALSNQMGGLISFIGNNNKVSISKTSSFTAGITTAIICFELLFEAFDMANKYSVVIFTVIGIGFVKVLDKIINRLNSDKKDNSAGVIVSAMAAHNITEGIAIGAGFKVSLAFGLSLLCAIMLHNIPEGMIIGTMLNKEKKGIKSMLRICTLIGLFLAVGAMIGAILGNIEDRYIMPNLALSAGAMLYVLSYELIPGMHSNYNYKQNGFMYIIGFLLGSLICNL